MHAARLGMEYRDTFVVPRHLLVRIDIAVDLCVAKSLADLLSGRNRDDASSIFAPGVLPLVRGERLGLALTVASSVLQLYDTSWLHHY